MKAKKIAEKFLQYLVDKGFLHDYVRYKFKDILREEFEAYGKQIAEEQRQMCYVRLCVAAEDQELTEWRKYSVTAILNAPEPNL